MNFSSFILCGWLLGFKAAATIDSVATANSTSFTTNASLTEAPTINGAIISSNNELLNEHMFTRLGTPGFSIPSREQLGLVDELGGGVANEDARNTFGTNQHATKNGKSSFVDLLVNFGVSVNATDNHTSERPRNDEDKDVLIEGGDNPRGNDVLIEGGDNPRESLGNDVLSEGGDNPRESLGNDVLIEGGDNPRGNDVLIEGGDNPRESLVTGESTRHEENFDIISGGTFAEDSYENIREERAMETNNEITEDSFLMNSNEHPSERFKDLDEVLAEASCIDVAYDRSKRTPLKKSQIRKRHVDLWGADDNAELEAVDGSKETADMYHDLVRAQVISLLDGRSLEEVTRDKQTMKSLMPLLKMLRGTEVTSRRKGKPKHDPEVRVEDNGTQENKTTELDERVSLHVLPPGDEHNASASEYGQTESDAHSEKDHREDLTVGNTGADTVESPARESGNPNSHGKLHQNGETLKKIMENLNGSFQNVDNIMKINDTYFAEVKQLMPLNDSIKHSALYKDFNKAVKDKLLNDILDRKIISQPKSVLGYDTFEDNGDDLRGQDVNKSASEEISNGNRSDTTTPDILGDELRKALIIDEDEGNGTRDDNLEVDVYDKTNHHKAIDVSDERILHRGERRRRKKHKHAQEDPTEGRNEHVDASGTEGGEVAHSSGDAGASILGVRVNATEPNVRQDQAMNDSVVGALAVISGGDRPYNQNISEHSNENTETSITNNIVSDHDKNSSITEQHPGIKEHSERRHHNKKMRKKTKEAHKQTSLKVDKNDLNETPAGGNKNEADTSLSSLLGEVLKSVSIYEVHGDVGQINIKTDSLKDAFQGDFDDEDTGDEKQTDPTTDGSVATGKKTGNVDRNVNSDSDTPVRQNLTRAQENTNENASDHNAQSNSTDGHGQSKQLPVSIPGGSGGKYLPTRKPYFKLLGYTKATPISNNTGNQTENRNETGNSSESKVMVVGNFENSSNITVVHESKYNGSSETVDEENNVNYSKMFDDELYDYEEKEIIPMKTFKRESDMADEHHDDDNVNDDNDISSEDKDSDGNIQYSDDDDDNGNNDDYVETDDIDDDSSTEDEVKYHEGSSDDNKDIDSGIDEGGIDDHGDDDDDDSSDDDANRDNDDDDDDDDDDSSDDSDDDDNSDDDDDDDDDDADNSDDDDDDDDNGDDDDDSDSDIDGNDENNGISDDETNGNKEGNIDRNKDDNIDMDDNDHEPHEHEHTSQLGSRKADNRRNNIENKNAFRRRIRYRGGPLNGTRLRKGLRLRKVHRNAYGQNSTSSRKLFKVRRVNKPNKPDFVQRNQNHGLKHSSDLLDDNSFPISHTIDIGKKKTGYQHGLNVMEIHHTSNETSVPNGFTDALSTEDTSNDNGTGNDVRKVSPTSHNNNTSNRAVLAKVDGNNTLDEHIAVPSVGEELKSLLATIDRHHNQSGPIDLLQNMMVNDGKLTGDQEINLDSLNNTSLEKPNSENTSSGASISTKLDNTYLVFIYSSTLIIFNLFS